MRLLTNHLDASGLTLVIASLCLLTHGQTGPAAVGLLLTLLLTCWFAFAVNDYFDAPYDRHDPVKRARNFFATHCLPRPILIGGAALSIGLIVLGFLAFGGRGLIALIGLLFATWAYSAPPLRLKSRPLLDLLMHATFVQTSPYAVCLWLTGVPLTRLDYLMLGVFCLSSLAAQLEQQARDFEVDSRTDTNFATLVGLPNTVRLLRLTSLSFGGLLLVGVLGSYFPTYFLPLGLIGMPVVLHRFVRRAEEPRSQRVVLASIGAALIYVGGLWALR